VIRLRSGYVENVFVKRTIVGSLRSRPGENRNVEREVRRC